MKLLISLILILISEVSYAGNVSTVGAVSFLSLSTKVSKYGRLNFYHRDIFNFSEKSFKDKEYHPGIESTYFQAAYSFQFRPRVNLSGGYIYQRSNPFIHDFKNEQRIFEQVVFGVNYRNFTLSHRFRLEERFIATRGEDKSDFRTRFRYQIGAKIPLRGLNIDAGEFYINTYNEFYFSTTGQRNAFFSDDWFYLGYGYKTKKWGSFEVGPLIQWSRINQDKDTRTQFNLMAGWITSF